MFQHQTRKKIYETHISSFLGRGKKKNNNTSLLQKDLVCEYILTLKGKKENYIKSMHAKIIFTQSGE